MKKYKSIIVVSFILMAVLCLQSANAISFVNGQQLITSEVNDVPGDFAVSENLAAWTDWRDDDPKVYAAFLNDTAHTRYTIDADPCEAGWIAIDANAVIYTAMNSSTEVVIISIANISDINNPVIEDINVIPNKYPDSFDVKDGIVVYTIDRYSEVGAKIYAIDLSDQYKTPHLIYTFDPENESLDTNISLDGRRISWGGKEDGSDYLAVCDVNDINNPQTTHTYLPQDTEIFELDTSNDWLVMFGYYMGQRGIFGLKNYSSSNDDDWVFVDIFATGELYSPSSIKIDEPFVVWTQYYTDGMQAAHLLMSALLSDNDSVAAISSLKDITDPNIRLNEVDISGSEIVWAELFSDQMTPESDVNLYNATLQIDCGDLGFSLADLNQDCDVNFKDLAILADQWLQSPGTPSADIAPCPNGDGIVNFLDFAIIAENWLEH